MGFPKQIMHFKVCTYLTYPGVQHASGVKVSVHVALALAVSWTWEAAQGCGADSVFPAPSRAHLASGMSLPVKC